MENREGQLWLHGCHPGKKLLFMGQEFAQRDEWNEERGIEWELLEEPDHKEQFKNYVKALWNFYKEQPALYEMDYDTEGFEWINHMESEKNMLTFIRKTKKKEELLVIDTISARLFVQNTRWAFRIRANIKKSSTVMPQNSAEPA